MIKAILVDDEPRARDTLKKIIENYFHEVHILGEAAGVNEAYELINKLKPDAVFLDIEMPDGSGFDLLKLFDTIDFKVLFVTAHEEHALKAIKFSAMDYILKPVNTNELREAIEKVKENMGQEQDIDIKLKSFFANMETDRKTKKKIVLKTAESIFLVPLENIVRCEADCNYTWVHFNNQPKILISKPLKHFDDMLKDFNFIRVHQSHLVNINHVIRVNKVDSGELVFSDNATVPISARKRKELFDVLDNL